MKAMTLRLDANLQVSLDRFSALVGTPKNRLVNEAVRLFLAQRVSDTERDLSAALAALKACRLRDPDHEMAIRAFADAESRHGGQDPFDGQPDGGKQSASAEIKRLLHG